MKTMRLNFNDLDKNLEVVRTENLVSIKGGLEAVERQYEYAIDPNGNFYWRYAGTEDWYAWTNLQEAEIVHHQSQPNWGTYVTHNPYNGGGYGGGSGGSGGTGNSETYTQTLVASSYGGATLLDIAGAMNTALGMAASHAQVAAIALELETKMFTTTSNIFAAFDIGLNLWEIFATEQDMAHQLEDWGQVALGVAIIFSGPVGAIVGGVVLAGWEIYEYQRDHNNP